MLRSVLRFIAIFALFTIATSAVPSVAADMASNDLGNGLSLIVVSGELAPNDDKKFANIAVTLDKAIVAFQSTGGNLMAGIGIGKAIRLKGFGTVVLDKQLCASACAIAWLGGQVRLMGPSALVGFHAAYLDNDGVRMPTATGNALVGAYLSQLSLSDGAIVYVTSAAPDDIQWLSFSDAQRVGIEVKTFTPSDKASPAPPPQQPASQTWSASEYWIQIFSRWTSAEALQIATQYRPNFANTAVFKHDSGYYVVVIGPFPDATIRATRDQFLAAGTIPRDSLITRASHFTEREDGAGGPLPQTPSVGGGNLQSRALSFLFEFHRQWSLDNASALGSLSASYADTLTYYGQAKAKADVMEEKRKFALRWPLRQYTVRPGTTAVTCVLAANECTVSGLIEWKAASEERKATSTGTAQYEFTLRFEGGRGLIVGEVGKILSRQASKGQ